KQTKVYRSNLAFKAVPLTKGRHVVVFDYYPFYFMFALRLYLLAMAGFFIFLVCDFVRYLRSWQGLQRS
ncbi:MAG TPA: hypothetical protein ACFYD2_02910, partial [Candidatus Avalokitesvara rifleensis]|uniref:hypothetical protein n=1 Tax=Candidatus Avalokitesvara rifleensis TaxID=3367620 RepID=UPI0040256E6C